MVDIPRPLFPLGKVVATPTALEALGKSGTSPESLLNRHQHGEWGNVCDEDRQANEDALKDGSRIFSVYEIGIGDRLYVITEADRSSTCILTPGEY